MKDMLVYYGFLNSFNSSTHSWSNEAVAQEMSQYSLLVFGDGVQDPAHTDYANAKTIIPRINELNQDSEIFGYVTVNQSFDDFKKKSTWWKRLEVQGVMLDEAGFDYGTITTNGREAFNEKVDFLHSMGLKVFANAWQPEDVLDVETHTFNPNLEESHLLATDIYMLESFAIDSSGYYESKTQWYDRAKKASEYDIKLAGLSVISDTDSNGQDKFDFVQVSGLMWGLDYVGTSDTNYGSGGATKMWTRQDTSRLYESSNLPVLDGNKYLHYSHGAKMKLDFTSTFEDSSITYY